MSWSDSGTLLTDHSELICCHALGLTGVQFWLTILNLSVVMLSVWQGYSSGWPFWTYLLSFSRSDRVQFWLTFLNLSVVMLSVWQGYSSDWPFWTYLLWCSRSGRGLTILNFAVALLSICLTVVQFWLTILNLFVTLLSVWQGYTSGWPLWTYLLSCFRSGTASLTDHSELFCYPALGLTVVQFWLTFLNLSVALLSVWQWCSSDWPFWTYLLSCSRSDSGAVLTDHSELICCRAIGLTVVRFWLTILNLSVALLSVIAMLFSSSDWPFCT